MRTLFSRLADKYIPPVNNDVINGLVTVHMNKSEEYLDAVLKSACRSFPEGIEYLGYQRCTPQEEYEETTKKHNNKKRSADLSKSSLYLMKYMFAYKKEPLPPVHLYLPFVEDGGIIYLSGVQYHLTPVLSNKVITPSYSNIFVKLLRYKLLFKRTYQTILVNGHRTPDYVVWSQMYQQKEGKDKDEKITKAVTCVAHYLFCKFGVRGTFEKYAGYVPVIGDETEITPDKYPEDKWLICSSTKIKPKTYIAESEALYPANTLCIAVERDKWSTMVQALVHGFFYVTDHFPTSVPLAHIDNTDNWKILLGYMIFNVKYSVSKLMADMSTHFESIDFYVDTIILDKLKEDGIIIEDFYDLLAYLLEHYNRLVMESGESNVTMFGKTLDVLDRALSPITNKIFKLGFNLVKEAKKGELDIKRVRTIFNTNLNMGAIFDIIKDNIALEAASYSGEHKYPKFTSRIAEQEGSFTSNKRNKTTKKIDETQHINMSRVEAGSILMLSKSNPTPNIHLNPFIQLNEKNEIVPNEELGDIRDEVDNLLKGYDV